MVGRAGEGVGIDGHPLLQALDNVAVFKEKNGTGGGAEGGEFFRSRGELFRRDDGAQGVGGDVPQRFMFRAKQHLQAGGLRVEGAGRVAQRVFNQDDDVLRRQRQRAVERIDGAARGDGLGDSSMAHGGLLNRHNG